MKKHSFNYKQIATLFLAVFFGLPSILIGQNFVDGVVDSVVVTPVNLTAFTGTKIEKSVQLNWTTTTEKNNSYFNIQRSNDGLTFENISKIIGRGNSSSINNYSFKDVNVPNNNLYYRLQQVDADGKANSSGVILVKYDKNLTVELYIYPNPVINHTAIFTLKNATIGQYNISLKSMTGETVFTKTINQSSISSNVELKFPTSIQKGFYVVSVTSIDGKMSLMQKIIIQ